MAAAPDTAPVTSQLGESEAQNFVWVDDPRLQKIMAALNQNDPVRAKFVGGCVRDSLIGITPKRHRHCHSAHARTGGCTALSR